MRLIHISLAAKYRVLFGVAVLLIIGVALYLPWRRVEDLAREQPFREAQRVVDDYFRQVMAHSGSAKGAGGLHGQGAGLLAQSPLDQPAFLAANLVDAANAASATSGNSTQAAPFAVRAMMKFGRDPKIEFVHDVTHEDGGRRYQYAHAVRVSARCLECHGDGKTATRYAENELAGVITVALPVDKDPFATLVNRGFIIAAGALAGMLAMLVFYLITHRFILSPINELREVARRVTEGDISVRSTLHTGDEFEQLADSFNNMLERLRLSQDDLRTANRSLDLKLGEVAETNVALYESNRVKTEFLANVSHELRTPLTSIIGFAELLRDAPGVESGSKAARYAENILISGRILLEIINDLLDLAKIEAGKVELRIEPVRLDEVCATLLDFLRPLSDKKRIMLDCAFDEDLPQLLSDRGRLRQILFNLLSNAIKFTPDGGHVRVSVKRVNDGRVRLAVSDDGPGIDPRHQSLIFEKFRQIDGSATREHYGTGLGLPIARDLSVLLGGEIGVESQLGHGATFWVELPTAEPAPRERRLISLV